MKEEKGRENGLNSVYRAIAGGGYFGGALSPRRVASRRNGNKRERKKKEKHTFAGSNAFLQTTHGPIIRATLPRDFIQAATSLLLASKRIILPCHRFVPSRGTLLENTVPIHR